MSAPESIVYTVAQYPVRVVTVNVRVPSYAIGIASSGSARSGNTESISTEYACRACRIAMMSATIQTPSRDVQASTSTFNFKLDSALPLTIVAIQQLRGAS